MTKRIFLAAVMLMALAGSARADVFGDGNQAYAHGRFEEAITKYETAIASGVLHEDIYYNLGNAYFRIGELGRAIYNYERALQVRPGMTDAAYNLEIAREAVAERVRDRLKGAERDPLWMRLAHLLTLPQLAIAVVSLNAFFFLLLILVRFLDSGFRRAVLVVLSGFAGIAFAGLLAMFAGQIYVLERLDRGIVLAEELVMREGASEDRAPRGAQLHAGLRVSIMERGGDWLLIRLSNGVEGWVPAKHIGVL